MLSGVSGVEEMQIKLVDAAMGRNQRVAEVQPSAQDRSAK